jgi:exonuclease III
MKIATFNINGINKRLSNLLAWLAEARPDIVCLQELKADEGAFPERPSPPPAMMRSGPGSAAGTGSPSCRGSARPC